MRSFDRSQERLLSSAPGRIDFTGGFTDVPELSTGSDSVHVSATIDWRVSVFSNGALPVENDITDRVMPYVTRALGSTGVRVRVASSIPSGSGLGASGALAVALASVAHSCESKLRIAEIAITIERDLGVAGGVQDQWAAVTGGINSYRFSPSQTTIRPLITDTYRLAELTQQLTIVKPPGKRNSSEIVGAVIKRYQFGDRGLRQVLNELNAFSTPIEVAIVTSNFVELRSIFAYICRLQGLLNPGIIDDSARMIINKLHLEGIDGVKILGGGGSGGCILVAAPIASVQAALNRFDEVKVLQPRLSGQGLFNNDARNK